MLAVPVALVLLRSTLTEAKPQAETTASAPARYDVASIRPNNSGGSRNSISLLADGLKATNVPLRMLIKMAYGVADYQISAAPAWVNEDKYDVEAKVDSSETDALRNLSPDQRQLVHQRMLQTLLADRFRLSLERVTKELPVYALVIAKTGPKLHLAKPGDTNAYGLKDSEGRGKPGTIGISDVVGGRKLIGQAVPMISLAQALTREFGRTVVDKTGLTGVYDFELQWSREEDPGPMFNDTESRQPARARFSDSSEASIFTAIQEQLGLKLDSRKGPVEILVINHVERPSEN